MNVITVQLMDDGPPVLTGASRVIDPGGAPFPAGGAHRVSLCRCGHAENKPFRDGSHAAAGFTADDRARAPEAARG